MNHEKLQTDVRAILQLYAKGQAESGLARARMIHKSHPQLAIVNYCVGFGLSACDQTHAALPYLRKAAQIAPQNAEYVMKFGMALLDVGRVIDAEKTILRAQELRPGEAVGYWNLATFYASIDKVERAMNYFEKSVASNLSPQMLDRLHLDLTKTLIQAGRMEEAEVLLVRLAAKPELRIKALARQVKIRPFPLESSDYAFILAELNNPQAAPVQRMLLLEAKARCLAAAGDSAGEYQALLQSKAAQNSTPDIRGFATLTGSLLEGMTPGVLEKLQANIGNSDFSPIYVVGLPRSGTTLTERILTQHQDVGGAGEINILNTMLREHFGSRNAAQAASHLLSLGPLRIRELTSEIEANMRHLSPGVDRIVDKLPHNFTHVGWIATLFPKARIIHCFRSPADNFVSGFKAGLGGFHSYFDRPEWFAEYYGHYQKLMMHWYEVLPGRIHSLRYESLVNQPRDEIAALLEFCGLTWQEACLHPEDNETSTQTASVHQVRNPINPRSVGTWKRYAEQVQPIRDKLGDEPLFPRNAGVS